jgi:2'-5' RNA ligase
MQQCSGHSLWLMPSGIIRDTITRVIKKLSTEYFTPAFDPHITLLGQVSGTEQEIIDKTTTLAKSLHPFPVRLGVLSGMNDYFRCLFARIEESKELIDANRIVRQVFNRETDPSFMPHLSLLYGNLSEDFKQEIISEIGKKLSLSFQVEAIHVISTNGAVGDWKKAAEISLG